MARILSISSQVIRGHVGNSAAVPALQALGHEIWPAMTIILSNHPAYGSTTGLAVEGPTLDAMLSKLEDFGWHRDVDAIVAGYFRSPEQVEVAARHIAIARQVNPALHVLIDPIIGDDPAGLYVPQAVAEAIRDHLLPLADTITPNRFELSWFSGLEIESINDARAARDLVGVDETIVTSFPLRAGVLANLLFTGDELVSAEVPLRPRVPNGTGDLVTSLLLGHRLNGHALPEALARTIAGVDLVLDYTGSRDELNLTAALPHLRDVKPVMLTSPVS